MINVNEADVSCLCQYIYILNNIYIRFGTKLYRQIVGIHIGTNCSPLVADLYLFCYERDFKTPLSDFKQAEIIKAFNSKSRYLDDLLNIDNPYFDGMVSQIYPPFRICIYQFQTDLFYLKFIISAMNLILI